MAKPLEAVGQLLFGSGPQSPAPAVNVPPTPPPVQSPTGNSATYKSTDNQPSFLAAAAAPAGGGAAGGKSLLGQ